MKPSLDQRIRAVLSAESARWYEGLACELVDHAWTELAGLGLGPASYSSTRVLGLDPVGGRSRPSQIVGWGHPLLIEDFDGTLEAHYGPLGLRPPDNHFDQADFDGNLSRAMALLDYVPAVARAVRALVLSLTPVAVEGPDYDTGYSDPALPFSIFIGAHPLAHRVSPLRLAEGLLHEAMHLQLSLIEKVTPLVRSAEDWRISPWQHRLRPIQGLLHGLYVFRVVGDYLRAFIDTQIPEDAYLVQAHRRLREIDLECGELAGLEDSLDLTPAGRHLARALLG